REHGQPARPAECRAAGSWARGGQRRAYGGMVKQVSRVLQSPLRPVLIFAAVAALLLLLAIGWRLLPLGEWLVALRGWIAGLGWWGVALFALIYIVGAVVLAPAGLLSILAGL